MAEFYYPFDTGPGASVTQTQWQHMAQYFQDSGVCGAIADGLLKVSSAGTSMQTVVAPGDAFVKGFFYYSDANISVTHPANTSGNPRIDLVILRLDTALKTIAVQRLQGTPAATPIAPTPTFPAFGGGSVFEIPLARVTVDNGVGVIAANKVTDVRPFVHTVSSYAAYAPSVPALTVWDIAGRVSVSGHTASIWGYAKYLGRSGGTPAGSTVIKFGLPMAAVNLGGIFLQTIPIMYMNGAAPSSGDTRTGFGVIPPGATGFSVLNIQNVTSGNLDTFFYDALNVGDRFHWNGSYEIA